MKSFKQFTESTKAGETTFTFEEIQDQMKTADMGIISAYQNDDEGNLDKSLSKSETKALKADLTRLGFSFEHAWGQYKDFPKEESYVVVDTHGKGGLLKKLFQLGKDYKQESVYLHPAGKRTGYFKYIESGKMEKLGPVKWNQRGVGWSKINAGYFTF